MNIFIAIFLVVLLCSCLYYLYVENVSSKKAYSELSKIINNDINNIQTIGDCNTILNYIKENYPKFAANRNIQLDLSEKYWFVNGIKYYLIYLKDKDE